MKRKLFLAGICTLMIGFTACNSSKQSAFSEVKNKVETADNARTSLDWNGVYTGIVPCADCEGIQMELTINTDETFELKKSYLGKSDQVFITTGKFAWSPIGNAITLSPKDEEDGFNHFLIQENKVILLDKLGALIAGVNADQYILNKKVVMNKNANLTNKYWKLVEIMGQPVTYKNENSKEAFIMFKEDGKVNGNFGCNTFFGSYTLENVNRIQFSQMGATMMMCLDMELETKFSQVLEMADNYNLDGDKLVLNKARMAPLARFEAVYM